MQVLTFHKTTDNDLKIGQKVCYQDQNGAFTMLGKITDTYQDEGHTLYLIDTSFGAYLASELKLISLKN